jgi:threonine/homoserine/homoserine lactone efflux protein
MIEGGTMTQPIDDFEFWKEYHEDEITYLRSSSKEALVSGIAEVVVAGGFVVGAAELLATDNPLAALVAIGGAAIMGFIGGDTLRDGQRASKELGQSEVRLENLFKRSRAVRLDKSS